MSENAIDMSIYKRMFDNAGLGMARVALDGSWIEVNDKFCSMLLYSRDELLDKTFQDITHPDDLQTDLKHLQEMLEQKIDHYSREKRYYRKDGSILWISLTVTLVHDDAGLADYFVSLIKDISQEKEISSIFEEEKKHFYNVQRIAKIGSWNWAIDTGELYWSEQLFEIVGLDSNSVRPTYELYVSLIHPEDREYFDGWTQKVLAGRSPYSIEYRLQLRDGTVKMVEEHGETKSDENGKVVAMSGTVMDVTVRKNAEKSFQESEARFRDISESSNEWGWEVDAQGKYTYVSHNVCDLLGYTYEEIIGKTPFDTMPDDEASRIGAIFEDMAAKKEAFKNLENINIHKNGHQVILESSGTPILSESGELLGYRGSDRAITEIKEAQQTLEVFRIFANNATQGMGWVSLDGSIAYVNKAFADICEEQSSQEMLGKNVILNYYDIFEQEKIKKEIIPAVQKGNSWSCELKLTSSKGNVVDTYNSFFLIRDKRDEPLYIANIITDITKDKILKDRIIAERNRAQHFLDMAGSIIVALNSQRDITLIKKHGADLLESTEDGLIGQNWFENFLVTDELDKVYGYFNALFEGNLELVKYVENKIRTAKGSVLDISWHNSLIYEDNEIVGILSSGTDITKQKEYEESIVHAKEIADAANIAKSNFLASMSHEIRTPMTGLLGFIQRLKNTEESPERLQQFDLIENSGKTLLAIINDILDFSKIESGKVELDNFPYSLHKLFSSSMDVYSSLASAKNISLHSMIDDKIPKCLLGDETRLKQVIFNLLSNAIKFTNENGQITLNARYDGEKQSVYIAVTDTGIGISKKNLGRIFEAFAQEDVSTTRKFGGTGLGLSISSHLVQLMGSELKVESIIHQGSKFYFEIPVQICLEELLLDDSKENADLQNVSSFQGHALVVEDNKTNQMLMGIILDDLGITYDIANDGAEGVLNFKLNKYDIVLMDENMPIMNGIESTKHIREIEEEQSLEPIPIIAVTANALTGDKEKFLAAGMDDYIPKPYSEEDIVKVLQKYLG